MASTDSLLVARIGKPHGLRGEVTVQTHTDDPEGRYVPGTVFATEAATGTGVPRALTLASALRTVMGALAGGHTVRIDIVDTDRTH